MPDVPPEINSTFQWRDDDERLRDDSPNWSSDSPGVAFFTIDNLVGPYDPLDLGDCILRLLTEQDLDSIRKTLNDPPREGLFSDLNPYKPWDDFRGLPMPLILDVPLAATSFEDANKVAHHIRRKFESALRLTVVTNFATHTPVIFQPATEKAVVSKWALRPSSPPWSEVSGEPPFTLDAGKLDTLRNMYLSQQRVTNARLRTSIRRFNVAWTRRHIYDDSLIDSWIGLEAMFSEGPGDIRFKSAMRVAYYLDTGRPDERTKIFTDLFASYQVRNQLVHGVASDLDTKLASRHALTALTLALRRAVPVGTTPDLPKLDRLIAKGGLQAPNGT
jgi:hypothetical protein